MTVLVEMKMDFVPWYNVTGKSEVDHVSEDLFISESGRD